MKNKHCLTFEKFQNINESKKTLTEYLNQFSNDTKSWKNATDEIKDIARTAKEYYNELKKEGDNIEALNFRSFKTPSEWNTKGKEYILMVYSKMDKYTKEQFDDYLKRHFNINENLNEGNSKKLYNIGDLVWNKHVGQAGLVGLVISEEKYEDDDCYYDVLYRGYRGDIIPTSIDDIKDIIVAGKLYDAEKNGDIYHYTNIADKRGIELNPKYQDIIDDENEINDIE